MDTNTLLRIYQTYFLEKISALSKRTHTGTVPLCVRAHTSVLER